MVLLPIKNPIDEAINGVTEYKLPRPYLGYSSLNHPCKRYLWYTFRWCYMQMIEPKGRRIFERGDLEEMRIIRDVKAGGIDVYMINKNGGREEVTGAVGELQEELIGPAGHVKGHPDGRLINLPTAEKTEHLLEIKTMNDKFFKMLDKFGVEQAFPTYWGQVNSYMGKMELRRTLFCATNKNNEDRKFIRLKFDPDVFKHLEGVAFDILTTQVPPPKIGDIHWHECRYCNAKEVCHKGHMPLPTCRSCVHGCVEDEGIWSCDSNHSGFKGTALSLERQEKGCQMYIKMAEII